MARQWFVPSGLFPFSGGFIDEDGEEEYFIPGRGFFNEDQAAAAPDVIEIAPMLSATPRWDRKVTVY